MLTRSIVDVFIFYHGGGTMTSHLSPSEYRALTTAVPLKRSREPRRHLEDRLQKTIVEWLRAVLIDCIIAAIPNGGHRSKAEGGILKATGVLAGLFDLIIVSRLGQSYWIEVKSSKGKLSKSQRDMRSNFNRLAIPHVIVRSLDEARAAVAAWNLPTREVSGELYNA